MYEKVSAELKLVEREKQIEKFWKDNQIFEKSMKMRENCPSYTFYDGPPTANGKPHIGHVLTRVIKDMIPRYRTMKGYMVPRKAGWDTHGLPVELEVEKKLGLDGKEQIEQYGLEPFIEHCKESVWKYKGMWEDFSNTVGFWADMDHPYVTYDNDFIESEWWALKEIWNKGLLYKGFKIVPYCPRCGTPLSSHEVAQGYKAVKERSAIVRFKVKGEDAYFLAWTTTPWTLPSNVALCVNPDDTYCKVKAVDGYTYYMAEALLDKVLGTLEREEGTPAYEVLQTYKGSELEYKEYEPLYACAAESAARQNKKGHFVTCDGYVSMSDGTGIVHIAPAFGEDDARIGRKYDLPFVQFVDGKGDMIIFHGPTGVSAEINRHTGAQQMIKEKNWDIKVVAEKVCNWSREEAMTAMENIITSGMKFDIIFAENDEMAVGALSALKDSGLKYVIGGIDAIPDAVQAVADGDMDCTFFQDYITQAKTALDVAIKAASGEQVDASYDIDFVLITKENVADFQ